MVPGIYYLTQSALPTPAIHTAHTYIGGGGIKTEQFGRTHITKHWARTRNHPTVVEVARFGPKVSDHLSSPSK